MAERTASEVADAIEAHLRQLDAFQWEGAPELDPSPLLQESADMLRQQWRPIETAPKGRKVIAGYYNDLGNWRSVMATYYPAGTLDLHDSIEPAEDSDGYAPEGWYEESETHEMLLPIEFEPTKWMPLPTPPQEPR